MEPLFFTKRKGASAPKEREFLREFNDFLVDGFALKYFLL
jgi:hypothetical protein